MKKETKMSVLYLCSCGIQIFSIDLVLDLLIVQHLVLLFPRYTDCKFSHGDSVHFSSPVTLSMWLVVACNGLTVGIYGLSW